MLTRNMFVVDNLVQGIIRVR